MKTKNKLNMKIKYIYLIGDRFLKIVKFNNCEYNDIVLEDSKFDISSIAVILRFLSLQKIPMFSYRYQCIVKYIFALKTTLLKATF